MNPAFFSFFESAGSLTYQQERSGYGDRNFILNCGSVFWFFVIYFGVLIVYSLALKLFKINIENKWVKKLDLFLKYNFLVALVVEGFIELLFSAVI